MVNAQMLNSKWFGYTFLAFGLLVQVVTYLISNSLSPHSLIHLSFISGCFGVFSVVLTAQGNIWMYLFGFAQVGTYTILCFTQRFYAEIAINAYYFLTMVYGVYAWRKRLGAKGEGAEAKGESLITPRRLPWGIFLLIAMATIVGSWLTGWGLAAWTDDTQPYLDAYTTVPALVAQVLMILVYREHWFLWLAVDLFSVVLWLRAGDYSLAALYAFWCLNCLYGLYRWRSLGISKV